MKIAVASPEIVPIHLQKSCKQIINHLTATVFANCSPSGGVSLINSYTKSCVDFIQDTISSVVVCAVLKQTSTIFPRI